MPMPKPMTGPNRTPSGGPVQNIPGPGHIKSPSLSQGSPVPSPQINSIPQQNTGPIGGPPQRSGPGAFPKPGMMGNPPGFGGPKPSGIPPTGGLSQSQNLTGPGPNPGIVGNTNTFSGPPQMGQPMGQNKPPQGFKPPQMIPPNKGPMKFPPKPGMYGGPQ